MKTFILIVILAVGAFFGIAQFLPSDYRVERSIDIATRPAAVYPHVVSLKTWPEWTAWNRIKDPTANWTFEGNDSQVGAKMAWKGDKLGTGELELTTCTPGEGVRYSLNFDGGKVQVRGGLTLAGQGGMTRVTWFIEGTQVSAMDKYKGLFVDSAQGGDLEQGLKRLKRRIESLR